METFDSDDERAYSKEAVPDKDDEDFYHDEVDQFHSSREKVLLEKGASLEPAKFSSDEVSQVLIVFVRNFPFERMFPICIRLW